MVVVSGSLVGLGLLVVALSGFAGFPYTSAEFGGVTLNAGIAMLVMLGAAMVIRSLTRQPLRPPSGGQPDREASAALGSDAGFGGTA